MGLFDMFGSKKRRAMKALSEYQREMDERWTPFGIKKQLDEMVAGSLKGAAKGVNRSNVDSTKIHGGDSCRRCGAEEYVKMSDEAFSCVECETIYRVLTEIEQGRKLLFCMGPGEKIVAIDRRPGGSP